MAISKNMLCNSVIVYQAGELDEDRNPIESEGVEVSHVYCVASVATRNGTNGAESGDIMKLFYDVKNSTPLHFVFNQGDRVEFDGISYHVNTVSPFYNAKGLQHYEIGLI